MLARVKIGTEVTKKSFSPLLNRKAEIPSSRGLGSVKLGAQPLTGPFGIRKEPSLADAFLQVKRQDTTILQFSDLQYYQNVAREDKEGINLVRTVAERVKPHLVVFTGDVVDGRHCKDYTVFRNAIQPLIDLNIPWTYVPGKPKHFARKDLLNLLSLPLCAARGATSFTHTLKIGLSHLHFLDAYGEDESQENLSLGEIETLDEKPLDWYAQTPSEREISLAFYHNSANRKPKMPNSRTETFNYNSGFFSAEQDLQNLLSGKDSWNNFVSETEGVWMCHGQVRAGFKQSKEDQTPLKKERWGRVIRYDPSSSLLSTWLENKKGVERNSILSRKTVTASDRVSIYDELD